MAPNRPRLNGLVGTLCQTTVSSYKRRGYSMQVRPANAADLERCMRLDRSLTTTHVWRMDEAIGAESVGVTFRRVRVPRPMPLGYPRELDSLYDDWRRDECLLVAREHVTVQGFLLLTVRQPLDGWIKHLVVGSAYRRRGVASLLLDAMAQCARDNGLTRITAVVQSKNDPAIQLLTKCGYGYRGFIDRHFDNGEVGLLYSLYL